MIIQDTKFILKKHKPCPRTNTSDSSLYLPDEIWTEILIRLPPKQVFTLNCVSKSWHTLISDLVVPKITDPLFGILFCFCVDCPSPPPQWDFSTLQTCIPRSNTPFVQFCFSLVPFNPSPKDLVDCCNGLFLFVDPSNKQYYVCNPSMEECVALPKCSDHIDTDLNATILCSPSDFPHFRVVHIGRGPRETEAADYVTMNDFNSMTGDWITFNVHLEPSAVVAGWYLHGVSLNESIYRLSKSGHLLKFDSKIFSAKAIQLPEIARKNIFGCVGVSNDCLHYALPMEDYRFMIWMLDESCGTANWLFKHDIIVQELASHTLSLNLQYSSITIYAFHPRLDILFIGNEREIFCYHLQSNKLEKICEVPDGYFVSEQFVYTFSHNLSPFNQTRSEDIMKLEKIEAVHMGRQYIYTRDRTPFVLLDSDPTYIIC